MLPSSPNLRALKSLDDQVRVVALLRVPAAARRLHELVEPPREPHQHGEDAERQPGGGADHRLAPRPVPPGGASSVPCARITNSQNSRTAPVAAAGPRHQVRHRLHLRHRVGDRDGEAAARQHRGVGQVVAHERALRRLEAEFGAQPLEVRELVVDPEDHVGDAELGGARGGGLRAAARREGPWPRRIARAS